MIYELYDRAAQLHGHKCPGLAIGVRAAAEARRLLDVENLHAHGLYCIAEDRACYQDGLQVVFGCTLGNGNLELRERGKAAFNFYDRSAGKSVRLCARVLPEGLSKQEMIDFILTAPIEQVFSRTEVRFLPPPDTFAKQPRAVCSNCGEECGEAYLRIKNGKPVCLDCAE